MGAILRSAGAVIAGLFVAGLLVIGVEWMSSILHPFPPGADPTDLATCRAHVARYPAGVLMLGSLGWGLSTLAGSWLATRLGSKRKAAHGVTVGLILLALAVVNMAMLPYPAWFWISNLILFPAGCFLGAILGRQRKQ